MPYQVTINAETPDIARGSLGIKLRIEERGVASFTLVDFLGTANYPRGTPVEVRDTEAELIFGGFIGNTTERPIAPAGGLHHSIVCMDNHYLADKRLIIKSYLTELAGDIFKNIVDDYLADEGITYTADSIDDGPEIALVIFNYVSASKAFDAIKDLVSTHTWFIDANKVLYFKERSSLAAPWALDGVTNRAVQGSSRYSSGNPLYRNRQYIRGGTGQTSEQTETFTGDAVTVAFTVGYPIALVPVVTVNAVGQTVGIKGIDTGKDCYWNKGDATITFDAAPGAVAVVIVYFGQYPLISLATNEAERIIRQGIEGGTGIIEDLVQEAQHDTSLSSETSARAKLTQYCQGAEKYSFKTRTRGLLPGQLLTVTYEPFGFVAHEMLIESVGISAIGDDVIYSISAVTGPAIGSWTKFFARLIKRQEDSIRIGDSLLLVLLQQEETLELTDSTSRFEDDFSGGEVGRWIALPPAQGAGAHVEHERLVLAEAPTRARHEKGNYRWGDITEHADFYPYTYPFYYYTAEMIWDSSTWG